MILNQDIIDQLALQSSKKKLVTGEYVTDPNNENFKYIRDKFYPGEKVEKVRTLVSGSGIFEAVANTIAFYVGNTSLPIKLPINSCVIDYIALWYACMWFQRKDGKLQVTYLPAESYIKDNGIDKIIRAYTVKEKYMTDYYYLITSYLWGQIENKLYKSNTIQFTDVNEVPLDTLDETSNLLPLVNTGLEQTFFLLTDDELDPTPVSLTDKLKAIVYSIDRNINMFDTQFLQNVESFVLLKGINLPTKLIEKYEEHWKIDFRDLGRYITTDQDWKIEFINNQNDLLDKAIGYEETKIARVSSISNVPMDFLGGMWTAGAIGEWSRELLHGSFIKRILGVRELFDDTITKIIDIMKWEDSSLVDQYSWDDVFSKNTKQLVEELEIAINSGIISRRTAMKRYLWYTDEEVDIELALLQPTDAQED